MSSSSSESSDEVDFNVYRKEYESEEHWNLRKSFMIYFWDDIEDEEEILCCAQLFINIEILGSKYSAEIMQKIKSMSDQVPQIQKYRERKQQSKSKKTFVAAQKAIQPNFIKPVPKTLEVNNNYIPYHYRTFEHSVVTKTFKIDIYHKNNEILTDGWSTIDKFDWENNFVLADKDQVDPMKKINEAIKSKNLKTLLRNVIVFENHKKNDTNFCLEKTIACMRKVGKLDIKYNKDTANKYYYVFEDNIIAEGNGDSKKKAKKAADEEFLKVLRANCYTIRSKLEYFSPEDVIKKTESMSINDNDKENSNQMQEDNLGYKLLVKLGWNGGSLGSNENGIVDPIQLKIKIGRKGFGWSKDNKNANFDRKYFQDLLENFKRNQLEYDLIFSNEFDKNEREAIHKMATKLNLHAKSYGKNESRHIVVSTRISPQVLRQKLIEGDKYLKEKYDLIPPPFIKVVKPRLL